MKEKVIIATMLSFLITIIWVGGKNDKSSRIATTLSNVTAPAENEENTDVTLDELLPENPPVNEPGLKVDYSAFNACALENSTTDALSFGEAFGYYRYCMGQDSIFSWNGNVFTTTLAGDVTVQVADTAKVEDTPEKEQEG